MADDKNNNEMFQLVYRSLQGINSGTYRERARIMLKYFKTNSKSFCKVVSISCETQVGSFAEKLFKNTPSFTELQECPKKCFTREIKQAVIPIREDAFISFNNVFEEHILRKYRCNNQECTEYTTRKYMTIGDFVFFEPYNKNGLEFRQRLQDIPLEFTRPDNEKMKLVGVVQFLPPTILGGKRINIKKSYDDNKENESTVPIGHYIAVCRRTNGSWVKYDDLLDKESEVKRNSEVQVALMLYVLKNNY